jgi:tetratricopeptide (TPR) repeat protein
MREPKSPDGRGLALAKPFVVRLLTAVLVLSVFPVFAEAGSRVAQESRAEQRSPLLRVRPGDAATEQGFIHFYNMDYKPAIADFEKSLATHPNDPYAVNHLLEGVLFEELHREGKLDAQLYLSNEFVHMEKKPPDSQAIERVNDLIARATKLEGAELARNPDDVHALYARSVTRGLRATEEALVSKEWFSALRSGLGAYDDSKRILELDPNFSDAKLVVGIYNYVVGSLSWPVKVAMLLVAIHGSRTKGLELMRAAADGGGEASVDAKTALALFLAREHKYGEALVLTRWLYNTFPHSFLYGLSEAGLLKSDGKISEAMDVYRKLIARGKKGEFGDQDVGPAAWGLGLLLRSKGDWRGAAQAFDTVTTLPHTVPELVTQAQLAAGQMYDRAGERNLAVSRYERVVDDSQDPNLVKQAKRWLHKPYNGA